MARMKFQISEEDVMDAVEVKKPAAVKESIVTEEVKEEVKEEITENSATGGSPEEENTGVRETGQNNPVLTPIVKVHTDNPFSFIRPKEEKEAYTVRKMVVMKPSVALKLEKLLENKRISFNGLMNQFIEAYVDAEYSIDMPQNNDLQ